MVDEYIVVVAVGQNISLRGWVCPYSCNYEIVYCFIAHGVKTLLTENEM